MKPGKKERKRFSDRPKPKEHATPRENRRLGESRKSATGKDKSKKPDGRNGSRRPDKKSKLGQNESLRNGGKFLGWHRLRTGMQLCAPIAANLSNTILTASMGSVLNLFEWLKIRPRNSIRLLTKRSVLALPRVRKRIREV
jgi:hypothetical protein